MGLLSLDLLVDLVLGKVESPKFGMAVSDAVFWGISWISSPVFGKELVSKQLLLVEAGRKSVESAESLWRAQKF
jgi:hypothetical protein